MDSGNSYTLNILDIVVFTFLKQILTRIKGSRDVYQEEVQEAASISYSLLKKPQKTKNRTSLLLDKNRISGSPLG